MSANPSYEQSKQVAEASREAEWKLPSFGKELFLGNLRIDLIHPQPAADPAMVAKGEAFLEPADLPVQLLVLGHQQLRLAGRRDRPVLADGASPIVGQGISVPSADEGGEDPAQRAEADQCQDEFGSMPTHIVSPCSRAA